MMQPITASGPGAACPPKPNGNMPHAEILAGYSPGVTMFPILTWQISINFSGIQLLWIASLMAPVPLGHSIWQGMYGNGCRIGTCLTIILPALLGTILWGLEWLVPKA